MGTPQVSRGLIPFVVDSETGDVIGYQRRDGVVVALAPVELDGSGNAVGVINRDGSTSYFAVAEVDGSGDPTGNILVKGVVIGSVTPPP